MRGDLIDEITRRVAAVVSGLSAEVVELNLRKKGTGTLLEVLVDKPRGGITLEECAYINREIVNQLDQGQWLGMDFVVEVSSPGLDRPLKSAKDFERAQGQRVRIHLREPVADQIEHHGTVMAVTEDSVTISNKNEHVTVPLTVISKAVRLI